MKIYSVTYSNPYKNGKETLGLFTERKFAKEFIISYVMKDDWYTLDDFLITEEELNPKCPHWLE